MTNKPLSARDVAAMLDMTDRHVLNLVAEGKLKATRLSKRGAWLFRPEDVQAYIEQQEAGTGAVDDEGTQPG